MYLWLNYCLFEVLVGTERAVTSVFEQALVVLNAADDRKKIWLEYASQNFNAAFILIFFLSGLLDIKEAAKHPL